MAVGGVKVVSERTDGTGHVVRSEESWGVTKEGRQIQFCMCGRSSGEGEKKDRPVALWPPHHGRLAHLKSTIVISGAGAGS